MQHQPEQSMPERSPSGHARTDPSRGRREREPVFPYGTVVGIVDDSESVKKAVHALVDAGFARSDVDVLRGERGIRRIDPEGRRTGLRGRIFRILDALGSEREQTELHVAEIRAGHFLVIVRTPDEPAQKRAFDVLDAHDAHSITYYSRWASHELSE